MHSLKTTFRCTQTPKPLTKTQAETLEQLGYEFGPPVSNKGIHPHALAHSAREALQTYAMERVQKRFARTTCVDVGGAPTRFARILANTGLSLKAHFMCPVVIEGDQERRDRFNNQGTICNHTLQDCECSEGAYLSVHSIYYFSDLELLKFASRRNMAVLHRFGYVGSLPNTEGWWETDHGVVTMRVRGNTAPYRHRNTDDLFTGRQIGSSSVRLVDLVECPWGVVGELRVVGATQIPSTITISDSKERRFMHRGLASRPVTVRERPWFPNFRFSVRLFWYLAMFVVRWLKNKRSRYIAEVQAAVDEYKMANVDYTPQDVTDVIVRQTRLVNMNDTEKVAIIKEMQDWEMANSAPSVFGQLLTHLLASLWLRTSRAVQIQSTPSRSYGMTCVGHPDFELLGEKCQLKVELDLSEQPECKTSLRIYQIGLVFGSTEIPVSAYATCAHNVIQGLIKRCLVSTLPESEEAWKNVALMWTSVMKARCKAEKRTEKVTVDEMLDWVMRFEGAKRRDYLAAIQTLDETIFSKKIYGSANPIYNKGCFVKCERLVSDASAKRKPRIIQSLDSRVQILFGTWCEWMTGALKRLFNDGPLTLTVDGHLHYVKVCWTSGLTPFEVSEYMLRAERMVESEAWKAAIFVNGDDSLTIVKIEGDLTYVFDDFEKFDCYQQKGSFQIEKMVHEWLGECKIAYANCAPAALMDRCCRYTNGSCRGRVFTAGLVSRSTMVTYSRSYGRISGAANTSMGNMLVNVCFHLHALGDAFQGNPLNGDRWGVLASELGLSLKFQSTTDPYGFEYCSLVMWPDLELGRRLGSKPGRILAKTPFMVNPHQPSSKKAASRLRAVALSMEKDNSHVPFLREWIISVLATTRHVEPDKAYTFRYKNWGVSSHAGSYSSQTRDCTMNRYDINRMQYWYIQFLCRTCASTVVLQGRVIDRIVRRDN